MRVISAPGSYSLSIGIQAAAGKSGIRIAASQPSLDLMGFELKGTQNSGIVGIVDAATVEQIAISTGIINDFATRFRTG